MSESTRWWRAWRARFGLAEVCGTVLAAAGFAAGYLQAGSLPYRVQLACEPGRAIAAPGGTMTATVCVMVRCTLTGPSCDSQDTILDQVRLPAPRVGDRVLIGNAGAYTTCYSGRSAFNGFPAPVVRLSR